MQIASYVTLLYYSELNFERWESIVFDKRVYNKLGMLKIVYTGESMLYAGSRFW